MFTIFLGVFMKWMRMKEVVPGGMTQGIAKGMMAVAVALATGGVAHGVVDDNPDALQIAPEKAFAVLLNEALPAVTVELELQPGNWTEIHAAKLSTGYGTVGLVFVCKTKHVWGGGRMNPIDTFQGCTVEQATKLNTVIAGKKVASMGLLEFVETLATVDAVVQ